MIFWERLDWQLQLRISRTPGFFEVAGMARIGRILTLCFRNTNSLSYNSRDKGVP